MAARGLLDTEAFAYRDGKLRCEDVVLAEVAARHGTPAYVYSAHELRRRFRALDRGLGDRPHLICYAVKANSNLGVLRLLAAEGAGMDVVSGGELARALRAGVKPDRIVFSGVGKTGPELELGISTGPGGIRCFNVESVAEIDALAAACARVGRGARFAVRFNPDVNAKTHPYISTGLRKNKFGVRRAEALEIVARAARHPALALEGLSIHIGSQLLSLAPLEEAFRKLLALATEIEHRVGRPLPHLDLGGGVGVQYRMRGERAPTTAAYAAVVKKVFGKTSHPLFFEPGRLIAGNSGVLLTRAILRKPRPEKDFLVVDAAMNDLIRPALYQGHHEIVPVEQSRGRGRTQRTDVVGPICETGDTLASERRLPRAIVAGDLLAVLSAGAYGFSLSSQYNSRPRAPELLVDGSRVTVLRARETFDDLIRGEN